MGHKQFTLDRREILQRLLEQGRGVRECARILGYTPSAICQEIKKGTKNLDGKGRYICQRAHGRSVWRGRRSSRKGKQFKQEVLEYVRVKLTKYWSPEQISQRIKLDFPDDTLMRISFKTIYRWLHQGATCSHPHPWQGFSRYLRHKRPGKVFIRNDNKFSYRPPSLPSIENRPNSVLEKRRFGDWEGDLLRGFRSQGYLVTLVERSKGLLLSKACPDKSSDSVNAAILAAFKGISPKYIKTITFDRGKEFYGYEELERKLQAKIYFCHPHCPNERGLNEQANGLLRQFFPKRKPLKDVSDEKVNWAVSLINNRPKKKFGYRTTMELIAQCGLSHVLSFA